MKSKTPHIKQSLQLIKSYETHLEKHFLAMDTLAKQMGLPLSSIRCLLYILTHGPVSPGSIAQYTSLTSGATSTMLEHLERKGYIERRPSKIDRRRVEVHGRPRKLKALDDWVSTRQQQLLGLLTAYSLEELAIIRDFLLRAGASPEQSPASLFGTEI